MWSAGVHCDLYCAPTIIQARGAELAAAWPEHTKVSAALTIHAISLQIAICLWVEARIADAIENQVPTTYIRDSLIGTRWYENHIAGRHMGLFGIASWG